MTKKHTFEYVRNFFEEQGCELLETEYKNAYTKMSYMCSCGNECVISFNNFQQGKRCAVCAANAKKHTFEYVRNFFEEQNCELIETEYKNTRSNLNYKCSCGNVSVISFNNFQRGQRCALCAVNAKYTYLYVRNYFEEQNCELLETKYENSDANLRYKCVCNNESVTTFCRFQRGGRCRECANVKNADRMRLSFDYVYNFFKKRNCKLLETEYKNNETKMSYMCEQEHYTQVTFTAFQQGNRCAICAGNAKYTYSYVRNYFEEQKCELLSDNYVNNRTILNYICECGSESVTTFTNFQQGKRCFQCGHDKSSKSGFVYKDYIFPSGSVRRIQGYEYIALNELTEVYKEEDIITDRRDMPEITYILKGKESRYYPDIWIKSENKIIEVKSCFTYKKELIKNIFKALATRKAGFDFEFWIYTQGRKNTFNKCVI